MFQNINLVTYINGQNGIYDSKIKNNSVRYARNAVNNYQDAYSEERINKYNQKVQDVYVPLQEVNKKIDNIIKEAEKSGGVAHIPGELFDKKIELGQQYAKSLGEFVDNTPEANFSMKYAQNEAGKPDTMAILGAAYEELGKRTSVSTDELTQTLRDGIKEIHKRSNRPSNADKFSADSLDINQDGKVDIAEYGASILAEDMLSKDTTQLKIENITGEITNKGQNALLSFAAINNYAQASNTYKAIHSTFQLDEAKNQFLKDKNNLI